MTANRSLTTSGTGRGVARKLSEEALDFGRVKAWLSETTGVEIDEIFRKPIPIHMRLTEAIKLASKRFAKDNEGKLATLDDLLMKRPSGEELLIVVRKYDPRTRQVNRTPVEARLWITEQARQLYFDIVSNAKPGLDTVYTVPVPLFNHEVSPAMGPLEELIGDDVKGKTGRLHEFAPRGCPPIRCELKWVGREDQAILKQMLDEAETKAEASAAAG
jgi:hypothetical protein